MHNNSCGSPKIKLKFINSTRREDIMKILKDHLRIFEAEVDKELSHHEQVQGTN